MADHGTGETGRLPLDGARTLRTADATHAALSEAAARYDVLEIDASGVDEVDLSFIQCLLAARVSARLANRAITLVPPASGALLEALDRGGFLCGPSADRDFWSSPETA